MPHLQALFGEGGTSIVYPCHSLVVAMDIASGKQRFFTGHTQKVPALHSNNVHMPVQYILAGVLYQPQYGQVPASVGTSRVSRCGACVGNDVDDMPGPVPESPPSLTLPQVLYIP